MTGFRFWRTREFGTACVLVAMLIVCEIASRANTGNTFLFSGQMLRLLHQDAAFVGIAAIGACLVIISGGVDLSSGSVMSLAAVTFGTLFQEAGVPRPVALLGGILAGGFIGLQNGLLVGLVRLPPFIATLGYLSIGRGICYWVTGGPGISLSWRENPSFLFPLLADSTAWAMVGLGVLTAILMARFSWGRYVYAVGGNEEAARFSGLAVGWIKVGVYTTAGLFSGLAGSAMALRYGSAYVAIANGYELKIIAACAVGGVSFAGGEGSVVGALLGAVAISVLENLLIQLRVKPEYIEIAYGSAIILAVSIDLHGRELAKWLGEKKDMKRFLLALLVLALTTGCGDGSSGSGKKKYRFALIPKMLSNDVFNYGRIGAEKTAKEIEAKENCTIEIVWQAPAQSNPAQQASIVQTLADQKVSGISVSVDEANTLKQAIDYAIDKGVPVMTFDSDAPGSKRKVFYGTDDLECGEKLAHYLGTLITKGKVIIQTGTDAPNLANRVKGAQDCFKAHFPGIEVVQIYKCNDDLQKAIQQIAGAVSTYPDLAGMVLVGGWAVFGDKGLDSVDPSKTKVVSCDALPKGQYIENGKASMLLAQDLWGWGAQSVRLLKDLADGKAVQAGADGRINGKLEPVTKDNLEAFKKQWQERFGKN